MESVSVGGTEGRQLVACHACDALIREAPLNVGLRSRCPRCDAVLNEARNHSTDGVLAAAVATISLLCVALFLPFVSLKAGGLSRDAGLVDAIEAAGGATWPLAIAVGAAIAAIPLSRALALIYVLAPIRFAGEPLKGARWAFRLAVELRPWSMIEIFVIGVVVALVKVAGLASVGLGAAFWIFVCLAGVAFYEDAALCRRTVWRMLG